MRTLHLVLLIALMIAAAGCAGSSQTPSTPTTLSKVAASPALVADGGSSQPPADAGPCLIGFDELKINGAAFTAGTACGLSIATTAGSWQALTGYGHPAPFIQFVSAGGTTTVATGACTRRRSRRRAWPAMPLRPDDDSRTIPIPAQHHRGLVQRG